MGKLCLPVNVCGEPQSTGKLSLPMAPKLSLVSYIVVPANLNQSALALSFSAP